MSLDCSVYSSPALLSSLLAKNLTTTTTSQQAYTSAAADISGMASVISACADKLHDVSPDDIDWGDVGDLNRIKAMMTELVQAIKAKTE